MITYRPDIDGLRALAVLPVVLFHADLSVFSGGYVGVDIFFVISGYLITSILLRDIKENKFSITTFYVRRVRRIFPALFVVLAFSGVAGFIILMPDELDDFGKSLFAASAFFSNYYFMSDVGYFAAPGEAQPLLHTWSLAVEEQFYIVFPLYIYVISKYERLRLPVTIFILIGSFVYSVYLVDSQPQSAFYSTFTRTWELALGAVLAIRNPKEYFSHRAVNILSVVGFFMIAYAIFFYTEATSFPGLGAVLPCLGAAFIIAAGSCKENMVGSFLSGRTMVFIGKISYSLYLWHWPILVYYKLYSVDPVSHYEIVILLIIVFMLSAFSWRYIETPFRKNVLVYRPRTLLVTGSVGLSLFAVTGAAFALKDGFPQRFEQNVHTVFQIKNDKVKLENCYDAKEITEDKVCPIGKEEINEASFLLWGDSHGKAIIPAINKSASDNMKKGVYIGRGGCLSLLGVAQVAEGFESCKQLSKEVMVYLAKNKSIKKVFIASRWALYLNGQKYLNEKGNDVYIVDNTSNEPSFEENAEVFLRSFRQTIQELSKLNVDIVLVAQVPEIGWDIPNDYIRATLFGHNIEFQPKLNSYLKRNEPVSKVFNELPAKLTIIYPHEQMCDGEECLLFENGKPIYRDNNHITRTYAESLSGIFDKHL